MDKETIRQLWEYIRINKKWWLIPIVLLLLLSVLIVSLSQSTPVSSYIYTLF